MKVVLGTSKDEPTDMRHHHCICLPPKIPLGALNENASSPNITKQFHIFPNHCSQMEQEQIQHPQSLHFITDNTHIRSLAKKVN